MESRYAMEELMPIVARLAFLSAGGESTSVSYEKAQQLMEAVLYCIQEYETGNGTMPERQGMSVKEVYQQGYQMVKDKVYLLKDCYHAMLPDFCDYGVGCLRDAIQKEIPDFFRKYDPQFCPQAAFGPPDYPLLCGNGQKTGVDAAYEYIRCIGMEQEFLAGFDSGYIGRILRRYREGMEEIWENICGIVLPNVLGHLLLQKPLWQEGFSEEEYGRLADGMRGREETEHFVKNMIARMAAQRYNGNQELAAYLQCESKNLAVRMCRCREDGCLERIIFL